MEHDDVFKSKKVAEPMAISGLEPYTLDELYARIEESHAAYLRGEVLTAKEAREELKSEFLWLQ